MKNLIKTVLAVFAIGFAAIGSTDGRGDGPIIYVTSQGLYYDSIVLTDVPPVGPFQQLVPTGDGLTTEWGPGDQSYVGGRWWLDANGNGMMDFGDKFFMCPLLGPGRESK